MLSKLNNEGQSMIELVVGIGLITVVVGALAVVTINSLQNTQYSRNQVQATKLAQENIEKARTIKNSNFGVCTQDDMTQVLSCSTWDDIWPIQFGEMETTCVNGCTFNMFNGLGNCPLKSGGNSPFCLKFSATRADLGEGFTSEIIIEDEAPSQKRVTSRVYWNDASGEHASDLVTVMSRY